LFLSDNFQEFFIDLFSSAAIKWDAKAYITLLKDPIKATTDAKSASPKSAEHLVKSLPRPQVNLGYFHGRARAEDSPTFSLQKDSAPVVEEDAGKLYVALVKLVNPELLDDWVLQGIGQTLGQLSKLSISPCVVADINTTIGTVGHI
jgi:amino-acid N-acetyltransferase